MALPDSASAAEQRDRPVLLLLCENVLRQAEVFGPDVADLDAALPSEKKDQAD